MKKVIDFIKRMFQKLRNDMEQEQRKQHEIQKYSVIIADASALLNSFQYCKEFETIYVTSSTINDLYLYARNFTEKGECTVQSVKAQRVIKYIEENKGWLIKTSAKNGKLLVENPNLRTNQWRSIENVSLACKLQSQGIKTLLVTHTAATEHLAKLQRGTVDVLFSLPDIS